MHNHSHTYTHLFYKTQKGQKHTFTLKTNTRTHTKYQHYSSVVFTEYHNMYMYITNLMSYKFSLITSVVTETRERQPRQNSQN